MTGPAYPATVQMRVPFDASSVSIARARLRTSLAEQGLDHEHIEDACTVISEMVANSVRHAKPLPDGNILLTWCTNGPELIVSVTDGGGSTMPRALSPPPTALAGRGMSIIEAVAQRWWAEQTRSMATVHACLAMA